LPRVAVVIPNWNTRRFLSSCLSSLRRQSFRHFEAVMVDCGSTDASVELVEQRFPEVKIVALGENRGFSGAANAGIRAADAELIALLNSDTEQDPEWLATLVQAADTHPEAGMFASKMLSLSDRRILDGAGDALRSSGLPYRLGHGERDRGQYDTEAFVFGACAAAALYRRQMLEDVGLFDEDFFAYCEDGDLSFRAQLAGYRCLYVPGAVVYHAGGAASGGKRSPTATRLGTRNSVLLLVKNLPAPLLPRLALPFLGGQLARLLAAAATGTLRAHLQGLEETLRMTPLMLRKRGGVQKLRRVPPEYIRRLLRDSSRAARASLLRRARDQVILRLAP
jgi:GT2 family glycosyltransferase